MEKCHSHNHWPQFSCVFNFLSHIYQESRLSLFISRVFHLDILFAQHSVCGTLAGYEPLKLLLYVRTIKQKQNLFSQYPNAHSGFIFSDI